MAINPLKKMRRLKRRKRNNHQNKLFIPPQTGNVSWQHIFLVGQSVMPKITTIVILMGLWTVFLKIIYDCFKGSKIIDEIFFPTSLVTYLGLVMSLLLVFRNNSAYDRFWEGRKAWSTILNQVRNLSRSIWIGVEIEEDETDKKKLEELNSKKGVMRLLIALVVSIKHSLRGEYGWDYDDLADLVQHVPRFNSLISTAPPESLKILPLEIAYHIQGYIYLQKKLPPTMITPMYNSLNAIIDSLTTCERILLTPIPIIYGIHIKHTLIFYLLTIPLQLIDTCGWATVGIVILTAFTLFGIEAISSEIENPFGSDNNDLKLDEFCTQIHDEIIAMMKYFPSSISVVDWLECEDIENSNDNNGTENFDLNDSKTVLDMESEVINIIPIKARKTSKLSRQNTYNNKNDRNDYGDGADDGCDGGCDIGE